MWRGKRVCLERVPGEDPASVKTRVNLDRYKSLLTLIASDLSDIGDAKGARFFLRWWQAVDALKDAPHPNQSLRSQVAEVQKSARAIVILAAERYAAPTALAVPRQIDLESAVDKLLEAARIVKTLHTVDKILADRGLPEIVNELLSSVEFVMDYVQLRFCGATLSALATPVIQEGHAVYRANDSGYRDALCRRIGGVVHQVELHEGQELAVHFIDDSPIRVSLRAEDRAGPESAIFSSAASGSGKARSACTRGFTHAISAREAATASGPGNRSCLAACAPTRPPRRATGGSGGRDRQ